ncbi:uncharacterized protein LOC129808449 [Phlebotomus papatasi]|uniref:uncharacterized protein LOC129808449 n=1 Tax=Phlebotomus papatasi TaxID=29031 RepID=UPI002483C79C|nr:uncharacterized protein LOC129808449 [Phlebotomus papatasi]
MAVIKEMRENSLLYDISNKKYQLRHRGALEASAEKLKISVKLLDQKIHYIKRKFNESHKEVRKQKILKGRSGDGIDDLSESDEASSTEDCKKPWKWYKACDFLKSTMNVNKNMKDSAIKRKITNNKDSKTIKFDLKSFAYTEYKVPAKKSKCESSEEPSTSEKEKCLSLVPSSESFQLTPKVDDQNSNELPDPISQVPETASPEFVSIDANSDLYPIRLRSTSFPMTEERTKKDVAIQNRGLPMGDPLSPVAADIVMDLALKTITDRLDYPLVCLTKYVDDIFCLIPKDKVDATLEVFNGFHPSLQFTVEVEKDGGLPYLDTFIIRKCECGKAYIGKTEQRLERRMQQHKTSIHKEREETALVSHARENQHEFDFDGVEILDQSTHHNKLITLEMLHINIHRHSSVNKNSDTAELGTSYAAIIQTLKTRI